MENRPNDPEVHQGHIRISSKEKKRYHVHRGFLYIIFGIGVFILSALVLVLVMKDYTDRKIAESNTLLTKESIQYNELERIIYDRGSFRAAYDAFSEHVVGIAITRDAFIKNSPENLATGIIFDKSGNILVPARLVRGRTSAFVRTVTAGEATIFEGQVVGIDEPSGIALLNVPALATENIPDYKPLPLTILQTVMLMGMPTGNPEHGNLTIGGVHSPEDQFNVNTGNNETEVTVFSISPGVYEGNDGGAVLTQDGRLAGMASQELTRSFRLSPYAAVLPVEQLKIIGDRILKHESVESLSLGVSGEVIDYSVIPTTGFYVLEVKARSTADRGGIRPTDIILSIDGQPVIKNRLIDSYMKGKKAGDNLTVELLRAQKIVTLVMKVY